MRENNRFFVILFALLFGLCCSYALSETSGTVGDLTWVVDENKVLTISGNGRMPDYGVWDSDNRPEWRGYTSVVICEGVENIGDYAFALSPLKSISIPSTLKSIGNEAFSEADLERITIPGTVTDIGYNAFADCYKLKTVEVLDGIKKISNGMFSYCVNLESITLPDSLEELGSSAFFKCYNMRNIQIPNNVNYIGNHAFDLCNTIIIFTGDAPSFDGSPFEKANIVAYYPPNNNTYANVKRDYGGTTIWKVNCSHEQTVIIPSISATCSEAGLTSGTKCTICNETIVEQQAVSALGHEIVINEPAVEPTCTERGSTAETYCSRCYEVITDKEEIPALGHKLFIDPAVAPTCTTPGRTQGKHCARCNLVVIQQSTIAPLGHDWNETITYGFDDYLNSAFEYRECLRDPSHIDEKKLDTIKLPENLIIVHENAFSNADCEAVIIPESCTIIDRFAFSHCDRLRYVLILSRTTYIDSSAFSGCKNIIIDLQ